MDDEVRRELETLSERLSNFMLMNVSVENIRAMRQELLDGADMLTLYLRHTALGLKSR